MASVVIGMALLTGRPGTASELPVSFRCRTDHADVSSTNPLRPAAQITSGNDASDMLLGPRASPMSLTSAAAQLTVSRAWPTDSHVRSAETRIVNLLRDGVSRSSIFRALVAALDTSDVIVYIESNLRMSHGFSGYLVDHVNVAGGHRYLHVVVNPELSQHRLLGVIAHELQHAVEVAETASVRSDADLRALFKSRDSGTCGVAAHSCTETDAAVHVQEGVLEELNGRTPRPRDR
jgi:hypothetical protein